eukprot:1882726-Rhodomonas_salina.1
MSLSPFDTDSVHYSELNVETDLRLTDCRELAFRHHDSLFNVLWSHLTPVKAATTHTSEAVFRVALEET